MARETKAERLAREAQAQQMREAATRAAYPERLMAALERAVKENFELTVKNGEFQVQDRDQRRSTVFSLAYSYTETSMDLENLEWAVQSKEEERAEQERVYNLRKQAFAKLSKEEQHALGLNSEFNW